MNQAAPARRLAIEEPPLSPGPGPGAAPAAPHETAAAERLRRFHDANAAANVQVTLRLTSGERIAVGSFDSHDAAKHHAHVLSEEIGSAREWLFLSGRFVRPEAIVSVGLDEVG